MNLELARKVADTVLYEGYLLYPYRPSALKNRQRWSFGILYPPAYPEVAQGTERNVMHSECLLQTTSGASLQVHLRFLHLLSRRYTQFVDDRAEIVPALVIDGQTFESWDEPLARTFDVSVDALPAHQQHRFSFPASAQSEPMLQRNGHAVGSVTRTQQEVTGTVTIATEDVADGLIKLSIDVTNSTPTPSPVADRNLALTYSLLSAHTILTATGAEFVSLLDPPAELKTATSTLRNLGNFPVLVGFPPERDMLLCSPIVLYDYPEIAPESISDFYDGTEMDEMLTLRVLTLTDEEKQQMSNTSDHVRNLLQRTEQSAREQLSRTHGTIRRRA